MIPQTQAYLNRDNDDGHSGDCWRTCIASILEIDRDDVPNFVEIDRDNPESIEWWEATQLFVREHGFALIEFNLSEGESWVPSVATILTGRSPRGKWNHSVVGIGRETVHDPHPSRAGLDGEPNSVAVFVAINPAKALR